MKDILISLFEGFFVGLVMMGILSFIGVETTLLQLAIISGSAIALTSVASSIGGMVKTGKDTVFYTWVYMYGETSITVTAGFSQRLYINNKLVDECKKIKLKSSELNGKLKTGEAMRAVISASGMTAKCELFVGNTLLQPITTKTP